jgi:ComF family protein
LHPLVITRIQSAAWHEGTLRDAIHGLKYGRRSDVALPLAVLLKDKLSDSGARIDVITSVPLHPKRFRERGYNQAELLARQLARMTDTLYFTTLTRTRATADQIGLDGTQRRANVAGAFAADASHVCGKNVLLVDDVCTTGATLDACAVALFVAGASAVYGLTVTRPFEKTSISIKDSG